MKKIENEDDSFIKIVEIIEIQKVLKYMTFEFDKLCNDNNIFYCSFGGTLLGAIRHKNFIPWDDDVDVCILKEDIAKLIEIVKKSDIFYLEFKNKTSIFPYLKIYLKDSILKFSNIKRKYNNKGLFIDVFPVYDYPKKYDNLIFNFLKINNHCRDYAIFKLSFVMNTEVSILLKIPKLIIWVICSIVGPYFFSNIEHLILNKFKNKYYYLLYGAGWGTKGKIEKEIFINRKKYEFGSISVYGITQFDRHLTNLYNDYMTIPEKIERKHNYNLLIKNTLYNYICNMKINR